jgi:uncharacterized protein (TIGR02679 family)
MTETTSRLHGSAQPEETLRFLSQPGLRRLWPAVRDRLERLGGARGSVRLAGAGEDERRAVADLLGLAELPRGELRIRLDRLDRALRESRFGIDLAAAMEILGGPLRDRAAERERERLRWARLWEQAAAHPAVEAWPDLGRWLAELRASGLLRRLAPGDPSAAARLLEQALAVLAVLSRPQDGLRLPVLANDVLGTSHGLDPGRPVATLVLRALAVIADVTDRPPPRSASERRDLWDRAGVVADDLSCDVLVLGLAPAGGGHLGDAVRSFTMAGEPARLTLRQLAASDLVFPPSLQVRVCENPVVVAAAADLWGADCPPLVCLGGFPNHAVLTLLTRLAHQGAEILYHGDFDWDGLKIANRLLETVPFRPWRFTAADYQAALKRPGERAKLRERAVDASWDPGLGPAMAEAGVAVEEEAVLPELLTDLERI